MTIEDKFLLERELFVTLSRANTLEIPEDYTIAVTLIKKTKQFTGPNDVSRDHIVAIQIRKIISEYFRLDVQDVLSKCRDNELVTARRFICLFLNRYTDLKDKTIADYAGLVCHSSTGRHITTLQNQLHYNDISTAATELTRLIEANVNL